MAPMKLTLEAKDADFEALEKRLLAAFPELHPKPAEVGINPMQKTRRATFAAKDKNGFQKP